MTADPIPPIARPGTFLNPTEPAMSRPQRRAGLVAVLILMVAGIVTLRGFLPALGWAAIFAIALRPVYDRLAARWPSRDRDLIPALLVAATLLVFVLPLLVVAAPIIADAHELGLWADQIQQHGLPVPAFLASLPFGAELVPVWQQKLGHPQALSGLAHAVVHANGAGFGRRLAGQAVHRLVLVGFMLVSLYFILRDIRNIEEALRIASNRAFGAAGEHVGIQLVRAVQGTVNGLVFVGLGEGVVMGVAYAFAGVPHPALFGLLTAILATIPFGAAVAIAAAGLALFAIGKMGTAIVIVALGAVVVFVADHFVRPVLIQGATRLPFVWVLLGILGGVEAWGLIGLVIGPAIMAGLILLWREWVGSQQGPINPRLIPPAGPDTP
ncbi:AI-2E family transporter [Novosphingobium olei]|uniref:AI-2E family transporter n=1 Tax=Novosphingobium olei TaxID=2728851 RepID=UPI001F101134|nr:AI-2E family transporter [Novosphingobium olei]